MDIHLDIRNRDSRILLIGPTGPRILLDGQCRSARLQGRLCLICPEHCAFRIGTRATMQAFPGIRRPASAASGKADTATEEAPELKQLAGAVAHELNNVLTAVIGNLSLLEDGELVAGDSVSAIAAEALAAARRGVSLSERLEAFAGRMNLRPVQCDMNRLAMDVVPQLRETLKSTRVQLVLSPCGAIARVDGAMMKKAIMSLGAGITEVFQRAVDTLRLEIGSVERIDEHGSPLPSGLSVHTRLSCTGAGGRPDLIAAALRMPYAGARKSTGANWDLAAVAGFVRQSGGELVVSTCTEGRIDVDLYIPVGA